MKMVKRSKVKYHVLYFDLTLTGKYSEITNDNHIRSFALTLWTYDLEKNLKVKGQGHVLNIELCYFFMFFNFIDQKESIYDF